MWRQEASEEGTRCQRPCTVRKNTQRLTTGKFPWSHLGASRTTVGCKSHGDPPRLLTELQGFLEVFFRESMSHAKTKPQVGPALSSNIQSLKSKLRG